MGATLSLITVLMTVFIPESPRLLLAQGKFEEAKACFDLLARWNGRSMDWKSIEVDWGVRTIRKITQVSPACQTEIALQQVKTFLWKVEITNLPPTLDEPKIRRILSTRMSMSMSSTDFEKVGIERQPSPMCLKCQLSFASAENMKSAIFCLDKTDVEGFVIDVKELASTKSDDSPSDSESGISATSQHDIENRKEQDNSKI